MVASIKIARSALSLTVLDGKLYAMGGFDGQNFLSIVEVYHPNEDVWEEGTPLSSGRSGHASAVIYQPSCASTYLECIETTEDNSLNPNPPNCDGPDKNSNNIPSCDGYPNDNNHNNGSSGGCCDTAGKVCDISYCKNNSKYFCEKIKKDKQRQKQLINSIIHSSKSSDCLLIANNNKFINKLTCFKCKLKNNKTINGDTSVNNYINNKSNNKDSNDSYTIDKQLLNLMCKNDDYDDYIKSDS